MRRRTGSSGYPRWFAQWCAATGTLQKTPRPSPSSRTFSTLDGCVLQKVDLYFQWMVIYSDNGKLL